MGIDFQEDNMWFQWVGMIGMFILTGEFAVDFFMRMSSTDCFYGTFILVCICVVNLNFYGAITEGEDANSCNASTPNFTNPNVTHNGFARTPGSYNLLLMIQCLIHFNFLQCSSLAARRKWSVWRHLRTRTLSPSRPGSTKRRQGLVWSMI